MIGSYCASRGIRLKRAFLKDDESLFQMRDVHLVSYLSVGAVYSCLAVCWRQSYFSHCLMSALTWLSRHINQLFKTGAAGNREETCISRWSDVLQEILLALPINNVDGTKLQNEQHMF